MSAQSGRPLKIVFYSPALPDSGVSNGIVTYSRIMRDALRAHGHQVIVVTTDQIEDANGAISEIPKPGPLSAKLKTWVESRRPSDGSHPWVRLQVLHALKVSLRARPDVIEMEESFGWSGRMVGHGVAMVERLHGPHVYGREEIESDTEKDLGNLREEAERASLSKVQAVTCPSGRLLEAMIDRYKLELPLARTIPNPMPTTPAQDAWDIRRADPNQILWVGRFDLRKGGDIVVRAFAKACEQRPSLTLVMAGPDTGLARSDGGRIHFDEFASAELPSEIRSHIRYLGPLSQNELAELRRRSGLAIITSRFENFAYSIAEAIAFGMPVLASDSFGNAELVRDGKDGKIVPIGDVAATADALLEMAGNPALLAKLGRSAYSRACDFLSPHRVARETVDLYREALARA